MDLCKVENLFQSVVALQDRLCQEASFGGHLKQPPPPGGRGLGKRAK
jgi:hypothetical protein